jgi:UDPglucose 6-dehydrogenase
MFVSKKIINTVAQIGQGFVGSALRESFKIHGVETTVFDKYKNIGKFSDILKSDIIFMCLPTPFISGIGFDLTAIEENLEKFPKNWDGIIVVKSTIEPGQTRRLGNLYELNIMHNPEFLTQRTAFEDFHNQKHIVLGFNSITEKGNLVIDLYSQLYPEAKISICTSEESEAMKLFCNNFYAQKVMIFNEFYDICQKSGINFEIVKKLMLQNDWINPMHTQVPGPDGKLGYGGACFIKDTNALLNFAKDIGAISEILEATIIERNQLRSDMTNIISDKK